MEKNECGHGNCGKYCTHGAAKILGAYAALQAEKARASGDDELATNMATAEARMHAMANGADTKAS